MEHGINSSRQEISQHLGVAGAADLIRTRRERRSKLHWFVAVPPKAAGEQGADLDR